MPIFLLYQFITNSKNSVLKIYLAWYIVFLLKKYYQKPPIQINQFIIIPTI